MRRTATKYRKLGRTSSQRKALLRSQVTALIENGKIVTTEARAKEVRKQAEKLITLAVKEKDNYETVTVSAKVAKKDADGKRVKEVVDGKKVTVYETVEKEIKKDLPSRLHARKQMDKVLYTVTEVPTAAAGKKKNTKAVDLTNKLFDEIAPKYAGRQGGYTRIVKIGLRKGDAAKVIERCGDVPVYTGDRELLATLTVYVLTRGVLCAMYRPVFRSVEEVCRNARRIVVIDGVVDSTNVGAIFRSAAALGIDAVLLTRNSCDPLNRRAVRVSMGSVFLIPWAWMDGTIRDLRWLGFRTAAMALTENSISIDHPSLAAEPRLAIVMGTEGEGLSQETIVEADYVVRIPMAHGVDSLNVAAAAAVAFWQLRAPETTEN